MDKQMTISAFSDELAQARAKKKEFLSQIERIVPWKEWLCLIQPCYYKGERGNKPYPLETMLRLYLLQNLYDLSDEATVAEVIDSRAFSDFPGNYTQYREWSRMQAKDEAEQAKPAKSGNATAESDGAARHTKPSSS